MPIFTEWLIPEALGLHTEVWIRAHSRLEGGAGFHKKMMLELDVAEKEPQNWEISRIEVSWRVYKSFFVDPWQMERSSEVLKFSGDDVDCWIQWNTEDLKQVIDLEVPVYSPKAQDFTLKALIYVQKHDLTSKQ